MLAAEVVQVERPNHDATQIELFRKVQLVLQRLDVVIADPLVVRVGILDFLLVIVVHFPAILVYLDANLVVAQKASLSRMLRYVSRIS